MSYQNRKWLEDAFSVPGATVLSVAQSVGCNEKTIRRWLKRYGLETRSMSENAWLRQANHGKIEQSAIEIIEGELLGDGNLQSRAEWSARYQHVSSSYDYLKWLSDLLVAGGVVGSITKINNQNSWIYHSLSYSELKSIHARWYPCGTKVVPPDLLLTKTMCLHWYLGDGCLVVDKRGATVLYSIRMSTDSFTLAEVEYLASQLIAYKPRISRFQNNHEERGYRLSTKTTLLDYIGNCPQQIRDVYGYKWDVLEIVNHPKRWRNQYGSGTVMSGKPG